MRALVLCPGPSLARVVELPPHEVLLAVNHAMSHPLAAGADWWVALDLWNLELPAHRPRRGMVTSSAAIDEGQARLVPYPLHDFAAHRRVRAVSSTMPAAIYWAAHLGATTVELLGCDHAGTADFRGENDPVCREPKRWFFERGQCLTAAERTGVELKGLPCPS